MISTKMNSLFDNLDKYIAIFGIILSLIVIFKNNLLFDVAAGFLFLTCSTWLLLRNKHLKLRFSLEITKQYLICLDIAFFILLIFSLAMLYFRTNVYMRPELYIFLILAMVFVISLKSLYSIKKTHIILTLIEIIIIGLSLQLSQSYIFPSVLGLDTWFHQLFTSNLVNLQHIPVGNNYSYIPLFHVGSAISSLILDLSYKESTILLWGFSQVIVITLFIFILGRYLFDDKLGLLASLLVVVSSSFIQLGFWIIPTSSTAIFIPILIYLLFKKDFKFSSILIILILIPTVILMHTIISLEILLLLIIGFSAFQFYNKFYTNSFDLSPITITIVILFATMMIGYWMYASDWVILSISKLLSWGLQLDKITGAPESILSNSNKIPFFESFFNNLNLFLFSMLAIWGSLYAFSKKNRNPYTFSLAIMGLTSLSIVYGSLLLNYVIFIERWIYPIEIIMSIYVAISVLYLSGIMKSKISKAVIPSLLVTFLAFIMIMNPAASIDNHVLSPNTGVTYAYKSSELMAAEFFTSHTSFMITSDAAYLSGPILRYYKYRYKFSDISNSLLNRNFSKIEYNQIIIIRNEMTRNPIIINSAVYKLDYNPKYILNHDLSEIYDSNSVSGYI